MPSIGRTQERTPSAPTRTSARSTVPSLRTASTPSSTSVTEVTVVPSRTSIPAATTARLSTDWTNDRNAPTLGGRSGPPRGTESTEAISVPSGARVANPSYGKPPSMISWATPTRWKARSRLPWIVMPCPSASQDGEISTRTGVMPRCLRSRASTDPVMPPPTMTTFLTLMILLDDEPYLVLLRTGGARPAPSRRSRTGRGRCRRRCRPSRRPGGRRARRAARSGRSGPMSKG